MNKETERKQQSTVQERKRRPLEQLNLVDDFLMQQMMLHPVVGTTFSKKLLEMIFGREFRELTVVPQKAYPGEDTDRHGIRIDVYLDEKDGDIVDLEPDQNSGAEDIESLPRRVRFYHAKIDAGSLASGMEYSSLRNVVVIFITTYDPLGRNRMIYTISSKCEEIPDLPYDDGAKTLFLYTKGTEGNPPEELKKLLRYMEHSSAENADTQDLRELHEMVTEVKCDRKVGLTYMKAYELEQRLLRQGEKIGLERGEEKKLLGQVIAKVNKGMGVSEIADALEEDEQTIDRLVQIVNRHAPEYDSEKILEEALKEKKDR